MMRVTLAIFATWISLSHVAMAGSVDLSSVVDDYRTSSWSGGDGITLGEVLSITQDFDGYLWLATEVGLVRFDGLRFNRDEIVATPSKLPVAPTHEVHFSRDGSLWVGYGRGLGLYRLKDDQVREIVLEKDIPGYVNAISEDRQGTLWVGHDTGLFRLTGGRWEAVYTSEPGRPLRVFDVLEDSEGTIWFAAEARLYRLNAAGVLDPVPGDNAGAYSLSLGPDGHVWVTDRRSGFRQAAGTSRNQLFEVRGRSVFHDSRQNLWLTTDGQGVLQIRNDSAIPRVRRVTAQTGLLSDEGACIFEDRDGNIWVCSIYGVSRLTPHRANSLSDLGVVRNLALQQDGTAWVGTTTGLIELTNVKPRSPGRRRVVTSDAILALHIARNSSVWVATERGLFRVAGAGLQLAAPGGQLRQVTSIASDASGTIWVADQAQGLVRVSQGHIEAVGPPPAPQLLYMDGSNQLWMTLPDGTVRKRQPDGTTAEFTADKGLPHTIVTSFYEDRVGDFWVTGNRGISRLVGDRFQTLSPIKIIEPMNRPVAGIVDDDGGDVWIALAYHGFIRTRREDLMRAFSNRAPVSRYRVYDTTSGSGYPDAAFRQPLLRSADNTLWSVTTRGISIFDPAELRNWQDGASGPPRIEGVTVDDNRYRPASNLEFPPRTNRLGIDYAVVSLSSQERFQFRYRLDGFDTTWIDGTGRSRASYTNLPPGQYRFRLQATTAAAEWDDTEVDWAFSIEPMFYQTRWFSFAAAGALGLCLMGGWRLRVRQVRKEFALVVEERLRLSRLIHDTLLQGLYATALQLDLASSLLDDTSSAVRNHLLRIRHQIEDYITDARQSIFQLRSAALDRRDLVTALKDVGERLTSGKTEFVLKVSGQPRACSPKVETHALRIGHEAIMNAVRHAHARRVEMEITFDHNLLRLRISDDGQGFDPTRPIDKSSAAHFGLATMHERAVDAGGRCTINAAPGAGVQVLAEFPLAPITEAIPS